MLVNKEDSTGVRYCKDCKTIIKYSNNMDDIYRNIEEYNPGNQRKILIIFDDAIADMLSNAKLNPIITEFFH